MSEKTLFDDFDVIYTYTRADALADGVLKDLTPLAKEAGIKLPTAITAAAWGAAVEPPADCPEQSVEGRAWDALNLFRFAALRNGDAERVDFTVSVRISPTKSGDVRLKALIHPGDKGEPVITIMLPHED